jgi:hypothetical protein
MALIVLSDYNCIDLNRLICNQRPELNNVWKQYGKIQQQTCTPLVDSFNRNKLDLPRCRFVGF